MIRPRVFFGTLGVSSAFVLQELTVSSQVSKLLDTFSETALGEGGPLDTGSAVKAIMSHIDVQSAAKYVAHKGLAPNVQNMMQVLARGGDMQDFSEESLKKARLALNELIEKGWFDLDNKIMDCKGFEDMNRQNYAQVTRDIARLIQQINDLERVKSEAVEGMNTKDQEIKTIEEMLLKETNEYNEEYAINSAQLTVYQNDMDVFQFVMMFTKCPEENSVTLAQYQVCQTDSGTRILRFADEATQAKYEKMLTPQAMRRLDRLLRSVEPDSANVSLIQEHIPDKTKIPAEIAAPNKEGVVNGATPFQMTYKCPDGPMSPPEGYPKGEPCGQLHDSLSLMWGEHKDKVDELTMIMMKNQFEFEELKTNLNSQIELLKTAKARFKELFDEALANLAADNHQLLTKYQQKQELDKRYTEQMHDCHVSIQKALYEGPCAYIGVRNAVHENSTECPPENMQDCDVAEWVPGQCSVSCDDKCDPDATYLQNLECGGKQTMNREVVVKNNDCGYQCPRLSIIKRCGQFKCPINCEMSEWSSWSKCTADCGGGVRGRTRSILHKPSNGGTSCNTVEDKEACGTGSCDRNCMLAKWTSWSPCSMACDSGFKERFRHVALPTRGFGKCPNADSRMRYQKTSCNDQSCRGDEICVALQDLVIAVDGSGSVSSAGFDILKVFVKKLLSRYETQYFGSQAVKVGIVEFGNGNIMPDGKTIAPAILVHKLSFQMAEVLTAVESMKWKHGFTNMAQAFSAAENAFILGSRRVASSAVMVITDGKPSFSFMTTEMVEQLDDKAINRYFLLVNEEDLNSDSNKVMKSWASQPWETNLVHVPGGLTLLEADMDLWVEKSLVKFCPNAYSPSDMEWEEANYGYAHVKDGGYCGEMKPENMLSSDTDSAETCAALVSGAGGQSFILGVSWARGRCYMGTVDVSMELFSEWQKERVNPKCEVGDGWRSSTLYDFYAMEPVSQEDY